ncbi:MAG: efflux RND transporter periplasmic adaptor subunit [Acidobacteriota bacterium]|nr:efflux RND transporter periplasmic adaptor subunit [Acidobacteriota bacterium]
MKKQMGAFAAVFLTALALGYALRGGSPATDPSHGVATPSQATTPGAESAHASHGGADDLGPRGIRLTPAAEKLAEIQTRVVERKMVGAEVRMVGKLAYDETRLAYISAYVPGRLDRLYIDFTGAPVNKGDHLVYLYSPELLAAQEELIQAIRTAKSLQKSNVTVLRDRVQTTVESSREKLRLWGLTTEQIADIEARGVPQEHLTIYSPMTGIVIHKNAQEGMYVQTGTRIYTIADLSHLWVLLDAYESDLEWLRYAQRVDLEVEAYPGEAFRGRISFIDPVLDPTTRTVKVRVQVENPHGRLKPEMFVRAVVEPQLTAGGKVTSADLVGKWISPMHPEIIRPRPGTCPICGTPLVRAESLGYVDEGAGSDEPPLVIPASAPLLTGKRAVVYVQLPDRPGVYEGREVRLGPRAGGYYLVEEGLHEGERVVVNGNFKLDSALQIRAKPSMMNPEGGGPAPAHAHGGDS